MQAYDVELTALRGLPPSNCGRTRVLVRAHGVPITLGALDVPPDGLEPTGMAERLAEVLGDVELDSTDLDRLARRNDLAENGPQLTVQIATKDRPVPLRRCLDSIAAVRYRSFDVIVVDNAPRSAETRAVVRDWERANPSIGLRYLQEPVPGAARAHNRALAIAEGAWVVRTDDDVVVDPEWLAAIAEAGTSAPGIQCVTGLILPAPSSPHPRRSSSSSSAATRGASGGAGSTSASTAGRPAVPVHHRAPRQRGQHRVRRRVAAGPRRVRRRAGPRHPRARR